MESPLRATNQVLRLYRTEESLQFLLQRNSLDKTAFYDFWRTVRFSAWKFTAIQIRTNQHISSLMFPGRILSRPMSNNFNQSIFIPNSVQTNTVRFWWFFCLLTWTPDSLEYFPSLSFPLSRRCNLSLWTVKCIKCRGIVCWLWFWRGGLEKLKVTSIII